MAEARRREDWSRTAELMALMANIHRDPRRRREPFTGQDFSPFGARARGRAGGREVVSMAEFGELMRRAGG